jgi:hypothetical protein
VEIRGEGHFFYSFSKMLGRNMHLPPVQIDPGTINMNNGRQNSITGYLVTDRPSYHIFPGFGQFKVDLHMIAKFDLFAERTFFPEQDRTNSVLLQFMLGDAMFNEEAHPDICTKIVILGMQHVEIGVKVGPADLDGFFVWHI